MWPFPRSREDWSEDAPLPTDAPSYDVWWNTTGRYLGAPYEPPAPQAAFVTSGFFYDPDLAKFGNAASPFVEMDAKDAHLAQARRFEDRYDPKYFVDYDDGMNAIAEIAMRYEAEHATPSWPDTFVGWSQPPHPIDVIPSFDPRASPRDQARAVLMDYYHDDPLRYWADNEAVKRCFGVKRKEDYDPALLVQAYENPKHKVWSCQGDKNTWKDMNDAVQKAIAHRAKLGPLPKSDYVNDPIVIYYYDNDKMKRITYPHESIPNALLPANVWWWKWGQSSHTDDAGKKAGLDDIHTNETDDPQKIAAERAHPGYPGGGNWGSEGVTWDKDMIGVMAPIVGALLAIVSAVLDVTGVGTAAGVALGIATPFIVAAIQAADTALHAGDFGVALSQLGAALVQAGANALSKGANIQIPPDAVKALGTTVTTIGNMVQAGQKKNLDFGTLWEKVGKKAGSFTKIGDNEAHTIAVMLGENAAGNVFIHGYEAGKLTDAKTIAAIANIMTAMKQFSDPRVINLFLLGAGIGTLAKKQAETGAAAAPLAKKKKRHVRRAASLAAPHITQGEFTVGAEAEDRLEAFVAWQLLPRYGLHPAPRTLVGLLVGAPQSDPLVVAIQTLLNELWGFAVGSAQYLRPTGLLTAQTKQLVASFQQSYNVPPGDGTPNLDTVRALEAAVDDKRQLLLRWNAEHALVHTSGGYAVGDDTPPPDWSALARGCPRGYWWDSLRGQCRPVQEGPLHAVEGEVRVHFYTPKSAGAMFDLVQSLQDSGIPMTGESPHWTGRAHGVLFALLWDGPEDSVRVWILDAGRGANLAAFWNFIDPLFGSGSR